jgi:DUF1365 family protein
VTEGDGPFINCLRRLESLCILGWRCTIDVSLKIMRAAVRVIREAESCTRAFPTFNALKMGMAAAAHPSRKRKRMRATQSMTSAPLSSADTATAMMLTPSMIMKWVLAIFLQSKLALQATVKSRLGLCRRTCPSQASSKA